MITYEKNKFDFKILYQLDENLMLIKLDKIQIQQVVINLLRNSIESMQDTAITEPTITIVSSLNNHARLEVKIIDNGAGFLTTDKPKLIEPYFSTKLYGMGKVFII